MVDEPRSDEGQRWTSIIRAQSERASCRFIEFFTAFRSMSKGNRLGERPMSRFDVLHMIKRRAEAAGLPYSTCCHTFRATGITLTCRTEARPRNRFPDRFSGDQEKTQRLRFRAARIEQPNANGRRQKRIDQQCRAGDLAKDPPRA